DLWRIVEGRQLSTDDLDDMVDAVVRSVLPETPYRTIPTSHPYAESGRQIDIGLEEEWIEVAECGLAARHVLARAGLGESVRHSAICEARVSNNTGVHVHPGVHTRYR